MSNDHCNSLYIERAYKLINLACNKIINFEKIRDAHSKLIYNIFFEFTQSFPTKMYHGIVQHIFQITRDMIEGSLIPELVSIGTDSVFVHCLLKYYERYRIAIQHIYKLCEFLSRSYVNYSVHIGIKNLGKCIFRDHVFVREDIYPRVQRYLLTELQAHRTGEMVDSMTVRALLNMIVELDMNEAKIADRFNKTIHEYSTCKLPHHTKKQKNVHMSTCDGIDRYIHSNIARSANLLDVSLYVLYFGSEFLTMTADYYKTKSMAYIHELSCLDYLKWVKTVVDSEQERLSLYLPYDKAALILASSERRKEKNKRDQMDKDMSTHEDECVEETTSKKPQKSGFVYDRVNSMNDRHCRTILDNRDVIISALICDHVEQLIDEGYRKIMENGSRDELILMYDIFSMSETSANSFYKAFGAYIVDIGVKLVSDEENIKDHLDTVRKLMTFYNKQIEICRDYFGNPQGLCIVIHNAFFKFMNINMNCTKLLPMYVDHMMKTGFKDDGGEMVVDSVLNTVMTLYQFLKDKDVFESFYETLFKKRILGKKTASDEYEKLMILKMKPLTGCHYTNQLEKMYADIAISKTKSVEFSAYLSILPHATTSAPSISISVLSQGVWKITPVATCTLPPCVEEVVKHFNEFYTISHKKRRLLWQTNLGNAIVKTNCFSRPYELNVSTYQMVILSLFNGVGNEPVTYDMINTALSIPADELKRHLISLTTPRAPILVKTPKGKSINTGDVFTINDKFSSKKRLVKVPIVTARSSNTVDIVPEDVESRRKFIIDAAIIRVMKSRKTLEHTNLVVEVTKQVLRHFSPSPNDIKGRIGNLINREYLERSEENRSVYNYVS